MSKLPFNEDEVEGLLAGEISPDDVPAPYQAIVALIRSAKPRPLAELSDAEQMLVSQVVAKVRSTLPTGDIVRRPRRELIARLLTLKAATLAVTAVLGCTAAAAATGSLPNGIQSTISNGLAQIGISVPHPARLQQPKPSSNGDAPAARSNGHSASVVGSDLPGGAANDVPTTTAAGTPVNSRNSKAKSSTSTTAVVGSPSTTTSPTTTTTAGPGNNGNGASNGNAKGSSNSNGKSGNSSNGKDNGATKGKAPSKTTVPT
jgi:hypothetical protein